MLRSPLPITALPSMSLIQSLHLRTNTKGLKPSEIHDKFVQLMSSYHCSKKGLSAWLMVTRNLTAHAAVIEFRTLPDVVGSAFGVRAPSHRFKKAHGG
jgi:hypothetical protein